MADDPQTVSETEEEKLREDRLNRNYPPSREVPAIFVNNFYVTGTGPIIRIAFAESAEDPPGNKYRVTVALPIEDAKELARVVGEMVTEIEAEEATKRPAD
jgi:hypothetical protein